MTRMKSLLVRSVARAYLMSFAFWSGIALLMGLQYRPLDPHALWSSLGALLIEVALRGFGFALWTPPIFFLVGKYLRFSKSRVGYFATVGTWCGALRGATDEHPLGISSAL
jgi:hypothetical protein